MCLNQVRTLYFPNSPECYDWSSAIDYAGGKGLVNIEMLY